MSRYNTYVASGDDEEFFKSAESLGYSVEEGPFYVTKGYNAVLGALGGVNVTKELQVVDDDMNPSPACTPPATTAAASAWPPTSTWRAWAWASP